MPMNRDKACRARLVAAARRRFLRDGIPTTGINAVTSDANVARMTLYNHFESKDDLVLAVFEEETALRRDSILSTQKELEGPFERVLALFVVALDLAGQDGFRGCAFLNLSIEAAAPDSALHDLALRHKTWIYDNVRGHLDDGTFRGADDLARHICVLWDGGVVGAYVHQSEAPIHAARDAAHALMRSAAR